ncbi:hypothetical protein M441DRAFT_256812 [Trichoderma asperellum CBS 433.97]|uniref:Uncharacterized protein n=1 Tax=Trichoderma asperellum (strain ATCC 204424 / CBS 433.97 / NBRC 101777) TaxID=1042311 RepID=A0A2T3YYV8_TRIA4|nr:hypothetical protein M441DRAFT_256812 [Trichoderma asperellum CBS 433.97]PTB37746.1 hypothetical protein M441DRAFT_256812 [Trichoderma asperellum CBS 433.97]
MRTGLLFTGFVFANTVAASSLLDRRDDCPSGSVHMSGFVLPGGSFDVCCPGTSLHADGTEYCCVGGDKHSKEVNKRDHICIGDAADCSSADPTSSCVTAVPATAGDFSDRVASATRTMNSHPTSDGSVNSASPTHEAAGSVITAAAWPVWAAAAGGAAVHAVLMA